MPSTRGHAFDLLCLLVTLFELAVSDSLTLVSFVRSRSQASSAVVGSLVGSLVRSLLVLFLVFDSSEAK